MRRRPPTTQPTTMPAIWPPDRPSSSELPVDVAEGAKEVEEAIGEEAELLDPASADVCSLELGLVPVHRRDGTAYRRACQA